MSRLPHSSPTIQWDLVTFIQDAASTINPAHRLSLDNYLNPTPTATIVDGLVQSSKHREYLLHVASELGVTKDPRFREALHADEERIVTYLDSISKSEAEQAAMLNLSEEHAEILIEIIQTTLDKGLLIKHEHALNAQRLMRGLFKICDHAPASLFVTGVMGCGEYPAAGGAFTDIFRALHQEKPVALKRLRLFHRGTDMHRVRSMVFREALMWKTLSHPNLLPFIGIDRETFPSSLVLVVPWMVHGNALQYLNNYGRANVNKLLLQVAQGIQYLHSKTIVHGNLRGTNILINQEWRACITDFGLSFLHDSPAGNSLARMRGVRWKAPELISPSDQKYTPTFESDVYAFGCVCRELYTDQPLFPTLSDIGVMFKIMKGLRPERTFNTRPVMTDALWQLVTECWAQQPATRPTMENIVQNFSMIPQFSGVVSEIDLVQELQAQSFIKYTSLNKSAPAKDMYRAQSPQPNLGLKYPAPKPGYQWTMPEVSYNRQNIQNSQAGIPILSNEPYALETGDSFDTKILNSMPNWQSGSTLELTDKDISDTIFGENTRASQIQGTTDKTPGSAVTILALHSSQSIVQRTTHIHSPQPQERNAAVQASLAEEEADCPSEEHVLHSSQSIVQHTTHVHSPQPQEQNAAMEASLAGEEADCHSEEFLPEDM